MVMEGRMASHWGYQEGIEELKQKLLYTTLELEAVKTKAQEEIRKSKENINHLVQLVQLATNERDEARNQLQFILNKLDSVEFAPVPLNIQPETPQIRPTRGNSSITESDSQSDTRNQLLCTSASPINSFIDANGSPDLSSINVSDSSPIDYASIVIDNFCANKALPEKGRLVEAVVNAGPLLKTLLVSGLLPRWRIPPPIQTIHVPPMPIRGGHVGIRDRVAIGKASCVGESFSEAVIPQVYSDGSQFGSRKRPFMASCVGSLQGYVSNRQRTQ